jgi:TetR/AcrR family transcriptional repressor of mexJK operon
MPPRDEQDYEQRRQQIIDGALEAFSAKGYSAASNKDIAEAAKIGSPGLIYHYFKDKLDLLHEVIVARVPMLALIDDAQNLMEQPPEVVLPLVLQRMMESYNQGPLPSVLKLILGESIRNRNVAHMVRDIGPGRGLRVLTAYLAHWMERGRLRQMDPHIAARILIGPVIAQAITTHIFELPESIAIDPQLMARALAEQFLRGMAPDA